MNKINKTGRSAYAWLYGTKEWKALRDSFLRFQPWCVYCQEIGLRSKATILDHIEPHKGNRLAFFDRSNLQPLCKTCHDSVKKSFEMSGTKREAVGVDGWSTEGGGICTKKVKGVLSVAPP